MTVNDKNFDLLESIDQAAEKDPQNFGEKLDEKMENFADSDSYPFPKSKKYPNFAQKKVEKSQKIEENSEKIAEKSDENLGKNQDISIKNSENLTEKKQTSAENRPKSRFVPLRIFSEFSLLNSCIRAKNAAKYCTEFGIETCALADKHNMFGMLQFNLAMEEAEIRPIVGCNLRLFEKFEVWAFCRNEDGYEELSNLLTNSYLEKGANLAVNDLLALKNCVILFDQNFPPEQLPEFIKAANLAKITLGIAISRQSADAEFEQSLFEISKKYDLPIVAAPKFYYEKPEQKLAVDALMCIKNGTYLSQRDREQVISDGELADPKVIEEKFADIPQALENAHRIGQICNFALQKHAPRMPGINSNEDPEKLFHRMVFEGLEMRLQNYVMPEYAVLPEKEQAEIRQIYLDRANYEIDMIRKMGFCDYFLIVADIVQWSKANDVPVGPGRGSGAGCLVAWCLQITNLNPIKYHLVFERFLNPDRVSLPDFDIDFCQEKRQKAIEYIQNRFGAENVAHIATFGSLQYRAALRDVGRVMQIPYGLIDDLCKKLPQPVQGVAPTLKQLKENGALEEFINAETAELFDIAMSVEGLPRHCSMHAAGLVIGNKKLSDIVPLFKEPDSTIPIIQFDMKMAEKIGLVKFDILGLAVLSILRKTCEFLQNRGVILDLDFIPIDDEASFKTLQKGMVKGVFQFESLGYRQLMLEMQPNCIEDIIAASALYRPGPMADIPQFVKCKKDPSQVSYFYPEMEPILKNTYGVIVYQEQVLQIAKDIAGYSLKEADLLRRAMGKKIKAEMALHQEKFVEGVVKTIGSTRQKAEQLFETLSRFASYGFAKAHAAPYGIIIYQTVYCKTHFPREFFCACLYYETIQEKAEELIQEATKMGVIINPPSLNSSMANFALNSEGEILFGLSKIKGIGEIANEIVSEREKNGLYKSIDDFIQRIGPNKRVLENFVYSGVFDCFGQTRDEQLKNITSPKKEISLFDFDDEATSTMSEIEIMRHEFDLTRTIFSKQFLAADLSQFKIKNRLSEIVKPGGALFCMGLKGNVRKTKDGRILNSYQFFDEEGFHEALINLPSEISWEFVVIELERNDIRHSIRKITPISAFLDGFRKICLEFPNQKMAEKVQSKIQQLSEGNTSIYGHFGGLEGVGGENKFFGNFSLSLEFLQFLQNLTKSENPENRLEKFSII